MNNDADNKERSVKIEMRRGRNYSIWRDGGTTVSKSEWAAWVKAGKRASILQVLGVFGRDRDFLQVCTGLSNRKKSPPR